MSKLRRIGRSAQLCTVLSLAACAPQEKSRGELMIAVSTDMSIPKNLDQVAIEILMENGTKQILTYPIKPSDLGKPMPGTLAIIPPDAGGQLVRIRVAAEQSNGAIDPNVRVVREATVRVPSDRTAVLPMPLHWLCDGHTDMDADGPTSDCGKDQTCAAGQCVDAIHATEDLPSYDPALVFGGGDEQGNGGRCMNVERCFSASETITPDSACSVALPAGTTSTSPFNVALVLAAGSDGECVTGTDPRCFLPIDYDAVEGWQVTDGRALLPQAVCDSIDKGKALGVATSVICPTKDLSVPICGPWTNVTTEATLEGSGGASAGGSDSGGSAGGSTIGAGGGSSTAGAASGDTAGSGNAAAGASSGSAGSASASGGADGTAGAPPGSGATAGAVGSGGAPAAVSVCDGPGTKVLAATDTYLEDFESMNVSPSWTAYNDLGPPGSDASDSTFQLLLEPGGAASTSYAAEYKGTGANPTTIAPGFGVGLFYDVGLQVADGIHCADISVFDGISFWAKAAVTGSKVSVSFTLPSTNSVAAGGDCTTNCFQHPFKQYALTTNWQEYVVPFAIAAGGSDKVGNYIQQIGWLTADTTWDFSIDELAFYKGTPLTGAVGLGK